jgi:cyanophycin synthetase
VPEGILIGFGEFAKAVDLLRSSPGPLVVKPAEATSGGAGVTMNVTEIRQLEVAFAWARSFGPHVAIEQQIEGDCYRVLVMDDEVLDTVVRHPPRVVGDGTSTVLQLILRENKVRLAAGAKRAQVLIGFDPDLRNMLATRGFSLSSRPAAGEIIALKGVINDNGGMDNVPANGTLCPAVLQSACTAARLVGARLAGIDIICSDPSVPLESSGGAVVDVNAAPGLYYHCHRADSSVPIADRVLRKAFNLSAAL